MGKDLLPLDGTDRANDYRHRIATYKETFSSERTIFPGCPWDTVRYNFNSYFTFHQPTVTFPNRWEKHGTDFDLYFQRMKLPSHSYATADGNKESGDEKLRFKTETKM